MSRTGRFSMDIAIKAQLYSVTREEAEENFTFSCSLCTYHGFNRFGQDGNDCEKHCPVASAHRQKLAAIRDEGG